MRFIFIYIQKKRSKKKTKQYKDLFINAFSSLIVAIQRMTTILARQGHIRTKSNQKYENFILMFCLIASTTDRMEAFEIDCSGGIMGCQGTTTFAAPLQALLTSVALLNISSSGMECTHIHIYRSISISDQMEMEWNGMVSEPYHTIRAERFRGNYSNIHIFLSDVSFKKKKNI